LHGSFRVFWELIGTSTDRNLQEVLRILWLREYTGPVKVFSLWGRIYRENENKEIMPRWRGLEVSGFESIFAYISSVFMTGVILAGWFWIINRRRK